MKIRRNLVVAILLAAMGMVANARAQGSLTPPGAPGPMMKTLQQVEPRIPITNAGLTITQPGSYYLTTNLSTIGDGITISADCVTLDLMGFALTGDRGTSDYGVWVNGATNAAVSDVMVRNGAIRGFGYGVRCEYGKNCRFERLLLSSNFYSGVCLYGYKGQCNGNTVADCAVSGSDSSGVYLYGYNGQCNGNTVVHCVINDSGISGVYLYGYNGQCNGNTVAHCVINGNSLYGVYLYGYNGHCDANTIAHCTATGNSSGGIRFNGDNGACNGNTIAQCTVNTDFYLGISLGGTSSGACNGNTIAQCTVNENASSGINLTGGLGGGVCDGNRIERCTVNGNGSAGVYLNECEGTTIADCTVQGNQNYGIYLNASTGNRVEGNHCAGQPGSPSYGIRSVSGSRNLFFRNSCIGQTSNFVIAASDTYGPIVTNAAELATSGAAAMSPWANFSR